MEKLNTDGIERQCDILSRGAQSNALSVARISQEIRHHVFNVSTGQTASIGVVWLDDNAVAFHRLVKVPLAFYLDHADDAHFAKFLLMAPEYLPAIAEPAERLQLVERLVALHSVANVTWVRNLLELGMASHVVRRLIRERIEADLPALGEYGSCFALAFLSDGHRFLRPLPQCHGVWQLFEKHELVELLQLIGTKVPRLVLSRMPVIREECDLPLQALTATCVQSLRSFHDLSPELIAAAKIQDLVDFLMRVRLENSLEPQLTQLLRLLRHMLPRVDEDHVDAITLRARGLTQAAEPHTLYAALNKTFDSEWSDRFAALAAWIEEHRALLLANGWIFGTATMAPAGDPERDPAERIGCDIDGRRYVHDRYAGWPVKPGMRVMLCRPDAKELNHLTVAKLYPLSGR